MKPLAVGLFLALVACSSGQAPSAAPYDASAPDVDRRAGSSIYAPSGNPTQVNGATVPAAGSLTTGNALQVNGSSSLTYAPVNLGGGANFVTGSLPTANQVAQSMAGDVTGTTAASVVAKVNGATVPAGGALTTGNVLQVSGAGTLNYAALNLAGGSNYVTGALPVANLANGTEAQLLVTNSGATAPAWVSLSGDGTISAAGALTNTAIRGNAVKTGTPAIWSQFTWDTNASNWAGIGVVSATLTDASVTVDCGLSSAGTLNASQFVLPAATALTASRTITVNTDSAVTNETVTIVRLGLGAFTLLIVNGGTGGGTLITLPASKARQATLSYDGTNWFLVSVNSVN